MQNYNRRDPSEARDPLGEARDPSVPSLPNHLQIIQGANKIAKLPKVGPPTYKLLFFMVKDIMNTCFKDLIEKKLYMAVV